MKFNVIGIGEYKGKAVYDEFEDALFVDNLMVFDFKRKFKDYLRYTKFLINSKEGRSWVSFQFIPNKYQFLERKFAIITAANPKNLVLNDYVNFLRNSELESVIKVLGYESFLSIGELFGYSETSFIVYDIKKEEALSLASKFDQHSIFYNSGSYISITECDTKKDILYYDYSSYFKEGK